MRQREFTYTPRENKEHPKFLPVINMTKVVEILDYWCEENIRVKNGDRGLPDIDVEDYWETIGTNLDVNIWIPDPEDDIAKIAVYPAEDGGFTDGQTWCDIHDHTVDFLKSHPELSTDSIKEWFLGESN